MRFDSILIVTYGRSGSTLFQGLLNALPGCLVRGENYNFAYALFNAYRVLLKTRSEFGGADAQRVENPWFGADKLDPEVFVQQLAPVFRKQLLGNADPDQFECIGFKEIRYLPENLDVGLADYPKRLREYLTFLSKLIPGVGVVFLTRDHDQVCRSAWWRDRDPVKLKQLLQSFESTTVHATEPWPFPSFVLDYADLLANGGRVAQLFEFLGVPHNPVLVAEVLNREHSFQATNAKIPVAQGAISKASEVLSMPRVRVAEQWPVGVVLVAPDQPSQVPGRPGSFEWNGVVVIRDASPRDALFLRVGAKLTPVQWGRKSPWAAAQYPDVEQAKGARYKGPAFDLPPGEVCELLLAVAGDEQTKVLATLERR
ncbi:sulfotransferase [Ideonella sp.]|uniref:sulfotransferase n=1 Tax=Ideonella sp. TaxID=1929293 RepID=UPI003BB6FCAE